MPKTEVRTQNSEFRHPISASRSGTPPVLHIEFNFGQQCKPINMKFGIEIAYFLYMVDPLRILLVGDNSQERQTLEKLLQAQGYIIDVVGTVREARENFKKNFYQIVLVDLVLPDEDRLEFLKKIGTDRTSAIIMTAYDTLERLQEYIKEGVYDFIIKPFTQVALLGSLKRASERYNLKMQKKFLEEKLAITATELQIALDGLKEGVFLLDENLKILRANATTAKLLGRDISEIIGQKCNEVVHGLDSPPSYCPFFSISIQDDYQSCTFYEPFLKKYLFVTVRPVIYKNNKERKYYIHTICDVTEQKNLRSMLEAVLEYSPYPILVLAEDLTIKYMNPQAEIFIDKTRNDSIGRHCFEVVHFRDTFCNNCNISRVKKNKKPFYDEKEIYMPDGKIKYFRRAYYPVLRGDGSVESIVEVFNDITALKMTERKLKESERFLRSVLEGIGDAVLVIDPEFRIITANKGFLKQTKRSLEEIIGKHCYEVSHGYYRPCFEEGEDCPVKKGFLDGLSHTSVHTHYAKNNTCIYVEARAYPLLDEEGRIYAMVETLSDITTKVHLQQKLQDSEKRYRELYNNAPAMLLSINPEGVIIECNNTFAKSLGYDKESLIGFVFEDLIPEPYRTEFRSQCKASLEMKSTCEGEIEIQKRDGTHITVFAKATTIKDKAGAPVKISFTLTDITELKKLQAEKTDLQVQLFQAQKMEALGTLAAGIAHDFNNMLMGIGGYAEIALTKIQDQKSQKALQSILETVEKAKALTDRILLIGRKTNPEKKVLDINKFIRSSIETLRRMVEENKEIILDLERELPFIKADEAQIYQVLMNLVVNARDAIPEGGNIIIRSGYSQTNSISTEGKTYICILKSSIDSKEGYVWFSVEDNGTGIEREKIPLLFDPFYTTKGSKGTGLGLSVVYSIVESHNGSLSLWTEPDRGTEFVIFLPILKEDVKGLKRESKNEMPLVGPSFKKVLIIDDEEVVREVLQNFFENLEIEAVTASTGEEALKIYSSESDFDLVIVDWVLPVLSGEKVISEILKISPDQKVIISTGYAEDEKLRPFVERSNIKVLRKPFKLSDIEKLILN